MRQSNGSMTCVSTEQRERGVFYMYVKLRIRRNNDILI